MYITIVYVSTYNTTYTFLTTGPHCLRLKDLPVVSTIEVAVSMTSEVVILSLNVLPVLVNSYWSSSPSGSDKY